MDFNSLIKAHLNGDEQDFQSYLDSNQARSGSNIRPTGGLGTNVEASYYPAQGHPWETRGTSYHAHPAAPSPQVPASGQADMSHVDPNALRSLIDYVHRSPWLQNNQPEPPIDVNDPTVRYGLISPGNNTSRFDAFIQSHGDQHTCVFIEPGSGGFCMYTNLRRQRVRAHVQSHFSYKPFICAGSCGKPECNLAFADNVQLADHVRRIGKPRTQCEICGSYIAPQNYRRHQTLMHSTEQPDN